MNIGFDGKRAANNRTGLGNYSRWLITQLSAFFPQNQYLVYTPETEEGSQCNAFLKKTNIYLRTPRTGSIGFLWRSFGIKKQLKKDHVGLFHGLSHEIPFGMHSSGIKTVVTIHDLIFLRFPQYYRYTDRFIYNLKCWYACKNSDRIIAISEQTKYDIIKYYKIAAAKVEVIYQSCDDSFKTELSDSFKDTIREKYGIPKNYILNVGTIEPRKNLLVIIRALKTIRSEFKLVVVGKKQSYYALVKKEIMALNLSERVLFLNDVAFSDLPAIYQMASTFVYPSFFEGFGIPIVEALYSQIPVIAATGSCLEEAGGPDSIYIEPQDSAGLSHAVNQILSDADLQKRMKQNGLKYVRNFDNDILTNKMMACYLDVVNRA